LQKISPVSGALASKGDAVAGINRADSASEEANRLMLRQHHAHYNSNRCHDRMLRKLW
jgi:hypothetical protein